MPGRRMPGPWANRAPEGHGGHFGGRLNHKLLNKVDKQEREVGPSGGRWVGSQGRGSETYTVQGACGGTQQTPWLSAELSPLDTNGLAFIPSP